MRILSFPHRIWERTGEGQFTPTTLSQTSLSPPSKPLGFLTRTAATCPSIFFRSVQRKASLPFDLLEGRASNAQTGCICQPSLALLIALCDQRFLPFQIIIRADCDLQVARTKVADLAYIPCKPLFNVDVIEIGFDKHKDILVLWVDFNGGKGLDALEGNILFQNLHLHME